MTLALSALLHGQTATQQLQLIKPQPCDLPASLKGASGHVLVRYTVNMAGKVNYVEPVFSVAAPDQMRGPLEEFVRGCVSQWEYHPAKLDGPEHSLTSTASTGTSSVEMLQAFHYFHPDTGDAEKVNLGEGRAVLRKHVEEIGALKLLLGRKLLEGPERAMREGPGWKLETNVRAKERDVLVGGVEFAVDAFGKVFSAAPTLPESATLTMLIFGGQDEFNQVAAFDNLFRGPKPAGQYSHWDMMAYTFASGRDHPLKMSLNYVVHETTHHLVHRRFGDDGRLPPHWVDEGVATYFELLRPDKKGAFEPSAFQRGRQAEGSYSWIARSETYLETFEKHLKAGTLPDLGAFLGNSPGRLEADLAYGLAWILTHYMINGEAGALKKPYEKWLVEDMGKEGDGGITAALGRSPEQILEGLKSHVAAMKRSR